MELLYTIWYPAAQPEQVLAALHTKQFYILQGYIFIEQVLSLRVNPVAQAEQVYEFEQAVQFFILQVKAVHPWFTFT